MTTTEQMIATNDGWSETESVYVDGYNTHVDVSVLSVGGVPTRISVTTDDDSSSIGDKVVRATLTRLGFGGGSWQWEAGEADGEGVAFVRGLTRS